MKTSFHEMLVNALFLFWMFAVGCESLYDAGVPGMEQFVDLGSREQNEEHFRKLYQQDRAPQALQWLLVNRIDAGLSLGEVNQVLGNDGVRVRDDLRFKTFGGHYRRDDLIYKWGPTSNGKSLFLAFRDGSLINFDPSEYSNGLP